MKTVARPWVATALAVLCNGLGHLYAGRPASAVSIQLLWLAASLGTAVMLRVGLVATIAAGVVAAAVWFGQTVHAWMVARGSAVGPRPWSSGPIALVAFYSATVVLSVLIVSPFRARVAHTVYAPSGSMIPTIEVGDILAVSAARPRALRGAIVELEAPVGARSRDPLLKRVVAVAGDSLEIRDGALWVNDAAVARAPVTTECRYATRTSPDGIWREERCLDFVETLDGRVYHTHCGLGVPCGDVARQIVPAGRVWVAGDHRDHSIDSRVFGPVAESSILGEVRWVLLSWGPLGPRWNRSGLQIR
jgi:signal peptidase I